MACITISLFSIFKGTIKRAQKYEKHNHILPRCFANIVFLFFGCCEENLADYVGIVSLAYMSVSGDKISISSRNSFIINLKHCTKFHFAEHVTSFFISLGKFLLTLANTMIYFVIIKILD